MPKKHD
jgi:hypothetical protein